jgi:hypothetical protein
MATIKHKIVGSVSFENLGGGGLRLLDKWESKKNINVHIPQLVGVDVGGGRKFSGNVRWYKHGEWQLKQAFAEIEAKGLRNRILTYAGSFVPRMIRGSTRTPSEHSFGTAFDINVAWNGLNRPPAPKGKTGSVVELIPIFEKWGFRWGGNFSRKDGMHFEIARLIPEPTTEVSTNSDSEDGPLIIDWNGQRFTVKQLIERGGHNVQEVTEKLSASRVYVRSTPKASKG